MKIGVVSDTHNNLNNIEQIISLFNDLQVGIVVHTGDIASSKALEMFSRLKCDLVGVYGNNDREEIDIKETAKNLNFQFQEPPKILTLFNRKIAIFHEPQTIESFVKKNRDVDIILHGHTHRYRNENKKGTLVFNPGESAGMLNGKNAIGMVNLKNLQAKRIFF